MGIVNHELDLLLRAGGIERDGDGTDAPGAEVAEDVLHRVLREDAHVLLNLDAQVEHGVGHAADGCRELVPGAGFPLAAPEILIDEGLAVAVVSGHVVNESRKMGVDLHRYLKCFFY